MNRADLEKLLDQHLVQLSEHFDAIQIVASVAPRAHATEELGTEAGDTLSIAKGVGNFFARRGLVDDWIESQRARTIAHAMRDRE
jgi:hypothetical protein